MNEQLELIMSTDLDHLPEIGFNFDELKAAIEDRMARYSSIVVTPDTIKDGKADRALLNKFREALESRRKEVKKQCLAPYNAFEAKIKELVALVDSPIAAIDTQLKAYEEQRKEARMIELEAMYDSILPEKLREIAPFVRVLDQKWLNATTSMTAVQAEMQAIAERTANDLLVLDMVEPKYILAVRAVYIKTHDIGAAIRHRDELRAAEEVFNRAAPTVNPPEEEKPSEAVQNAQTAPEPAPEPAAEASPKLYRLRLEMQLTMEQANALKKFLADNNITYQKI